VLATCFPVLAFVTDLGVERGIEWMLTIFVVCLCSFTNRTNITYPFLGLNKVLELSYVAVFCSCIKSVMFHLRLFFFKAMEKACATSFLLFTLDIQELSSVLLSP